MTIKSATAADDASSIPVAEAIVSYPPYQNQPNDLEGGGGFRGTETITDALLVTDDNDNNNINNGSNNNNDNNKGDKKNDGCDKNNNNNSFHLLNESTQQYWGRFDDNAAVTDVTYTDEPAIATARPTEDCQVRLKFIRKVYSILSVQLLATFAICALFALHEPTKHFVTTHVGFYWFNLIVALVSLFPLHYYKRSYPANFALLSIFTLAMASTIGMITTMYAEAGAGDLVLEAVAITASVFIVLTIYTMQSKWDFSFMGAGLGMGLWIMILWGFFAAIFGIQTGMVYALGGSVLFSGFIIYDTYMIAERLDPEDYIVGAIELYLDLVNLFLYMLQLLSELQRR
mmetsp:Transcript_21133/g.21539  ORF Transcript_21133/g.21539 Transcript_21133/m.21539 type:complete len:344 (-) Transcript_21133:139-1170(-)